MPQWACNRDRLSIVLVLFLLCLPFHFASSQSIPDEQTDHPDAAFERLVIVLGVSGALSVDVRESIATELAGFDTTVIDLSTQSLDSTDWTEIARVIAVGVTGCQQIVEQRLQLPVLCVLLTEENFRLIDQNRDAANEHSVHALVIDQPVSRQAQIAQRVYPALSSFAVLSDTPKDSNDAQSYDLIYSTYLETRALAQQLTQAIATTDALIATPDSDVFNRSTLRTVLLTAYGYGKPVIGLSKAYVNAGALITAYSTPAQVLKEVADSLRTAKFEESTLGRVDYPRYFSVIDNINVAKSLGLTKLFRFDAFMTYEDGDFRP